jgi:hypothetical protein
MAYLTNYIFSKPSSSALEDGTVDMEVLKKKRLGR